MKIGPIQFSKKKLIFLTGFIFISGISAYLSFKIFNKKDLAIIYEKTDLTANKYEVKFPDTVWSHVEEDLARSLQKKEETENTNPTPKSQHKMQINEKYIQELSKRLPPVEPFKFSVLLSEKTQGSLYGKNHEIIFPEGGGKLDLSQFVSKTQGSFYLKIVWDSKTLPIKNTKIYFLSRSQVREVEGKKLGNGCDMFFDLSSYWLNQMKGMGLFLNNSYQRHVSLLAGTYYFTVTIQGKLYSAVLDIIDTDHRHLLCAQ